MRYGVTLPHEAFQSRDLLELTRRVEDLGYTDAWSFESFGTDAFSPLAAMAAVTQNLRLGTAIVPVFTRPAGLIAMSAATVQNISAGRFVLGLGISTPTIVQNWMNVPYQRPVTKLRETVEVVRASLTRQKVNFEGKTMKISGFRLDVPPAYPAPPIYIGAQGPKMLRVAGEIGDGVIVNFVTTENLPSMLKHVHEGARAAGKPTSGLDVVCRIMVAVDEDDTVVRNEMRRSLAAYVTVPQYNKFFSEFGFEDEAKRAIEAWQAGDRKAAVQAIGDKMLESIYVFGSAAHCRERLQAYAAAGVTTPAIAFVSLAPSLEERRAKTLQAIEAFAPR
jgi:probable F420-dependent oxidoreductase